MATKTKRWAFGVVGLGNISDFHAEAANEVRGGTMYACYSRSPEKAAAFAAKHKCRAYSDFEMFLQDPELDIVTIATPSGAHLEPAIAAARAGKHVICEKPLEVNPARCRRIISACKRHKVELVTIFPTRFKDVSIAMKKAMDAGRLGKPVNGSAYIKWFRDQAYYDSGAWRGTWKLDGGGCLMNQAIHNVDMLIHLMGDVREVFAYATRPGRKRIEVETNLVATLRFKSGAIGVIEASTEVYPGFAKAIQISGTGGTMSCSEDDLDFWGFAKPLASDLRTLEKFSVKTGTTGGAADPLAISSDGHRRQFQELVDVLKGRKDRLTCDGEQGIRSVKLICAIYESVRTGKPVKVK